MSVRIKIFGFDMRGLSQKVREGIVEELNSGAESMVSLAKQLAPVDTGFLRDNISQTEKATINNMRVMVESQAPYSEFVEYGTINSEAQPFMTPAYESARRQVTNGMIRVMREAASKKAT